jgi:hypothetical protein
MLKPSDYPAYVAPIGAVSAPTAPCMLREDAKISFDMLLKKKLSTRAEAWTVWCPTC